MIQEDKEGKEETTTRRKRKTNCEWCKRRLKWKNNHGYADLSKADKKLSIICKKCFEKENRKHTLVASVGMPEGKK